MSVANKPTNPAMNEQARPITIPPDGVNKILRRYLEVNSVDGI